jgi:Ca2+-binding RTX toxin-like protein
LSETRVQPVASLCVRTGAKADFSIDVGHPAPQDTRQGPLARRLAEYKERNDAIYGSGGSDKIYGNAGNDLIQTRGPGPPDRGRAESQVVR